MNYPSDSASDEPAGHTGSRSVSGGFFVFAAPKNFPPVITTTPSGTADLDAPSIYDADAYDKNPLDAITFSLQGAPAGMTIGADDGVILWEPEGAYPAHVELTLVASDGVAETTQPISLQVPGGVETTSATAGAGGGEGEGEGGAGGAGAAPGADEDGCSCTVAGGSRRDGDGALALFLLTAAAGVFRARSRRAIRLRS
jgi:hypothetical protein